MAEMEEQHLDKHNSRQVAAKSLQVFVASFNLASHGIEIKEWEEEREGGNTWLDESFGI